MIKKGDFVDFLNICCNAKFKSNDNKRKIQKFIDSVYSKNNINILANEYECWLPSEFEDDFFRNLLGTVDSQSKLLRYISLSALNRLVLSNTQSMLSVVSMNDRSEVDYTESYFKNKFNKDKDQDECIEDTIDVYILSCIEGEKDELTMWRLYGEDSRGACIGYSIDTNLINNLDFILAPISYADKNHKHRELDLVYYMMTRGIIINNSNSKTKVKFVFKRWNIWKHFFKPYDYHDEHEVRLLYRNQNKPNKKKWILSSLNIFTPLIEFVGYIDEEGTNNIKKLPLKIDKIKLGPNYPEKKLNKEILLSLMKESNSSITIAQSTIDSYRL